MSKHLVDGGKQTFMERYELKCRLGTGHFGQVFEVCERATGINWAAKVINKEKCSAKSLEDEIFIMEKIKHKHAVALKEYYSDRDYLVLILELLTGGELFDRILEMPFTEQEASKFFRESLSVVKHLHDQGIVHRDLKPENILILSKDPPFVLKIADFGLSKIVPKDEYLIEVAGTPNYMAPEIFQRKPYGRPVDMWAMGVVLYVTLSGLFPYEWKDKTFIFDFPSPEFDKISASAKEVISRMLDRNPKTRITVDEALQHPWVTGRTATYVEIPKQGLQEFNARRRFKRAGETIRSALRIKGIAAGALKTRLADNIAKKASMQDKLSTFEEELAKASTVVSTVVEKAKELAKGESTAEEQQTAHEITTRIRAMVLALQEDAKKLQQLAATIDQKTSSSEQK
eukprot:TRINITY_DN3034_c0_g1_i2.p1 TRINITY_DN3034_c0_g1~~TRINITY_DN3034_c0_g1_i2.p1  ORF type:complete len:401 (+),score=111.39 TRINITY_DN3034_c0_g1_i2:70-1272(+)